MIHILHLDTSPRGNHSVSCTLAKFVSDWKADFVHADSLALGDEVRNQALAKNELSRRLPSD